jgi:hypothetical protein
VHVRMCAHITRERVWVSRLSTITSVKKQSHHHDDTSMTELFLVTVFSQVSLSMSRVQGAEMRRLYTFPSPSRCRRHFLSVLSSPA